jgi:multiple antibiotic resistance protein
LACWRHRSQGERSDIFIFGGRVGGSDAVDAPTFVAIVVSIFAIVNPVGTIPTFVALTAGYTSAERRGVIVKAVLVGAGVLLAFGLVGERIFDVFSITIPAFRIAGGILIFKVAFDMLHGERPRSDSNEQEITDALERENVGITPLGVPLLTGPGAITTVMILVATHTAAADRLLIYGAVGIVFAATFALLFVGERLFGFMGRSGLMVFTRIMGLLLAALAVQFVLTGVTAALPALVRVT